MVVLHYKKTDLNQFLFETSTSIKVDQLLYDLCEGKSDSKNIMNEEEVLTHRNKDGLGL